MQIHTLAYLRATSLLYSNKTKLAINRKIYPDTEYILVIFFAHIFLDQLYESYK